MFFFRSRTQQLLEQKREECLVGMLDEIMASVSMAVGYMRIVSNTSHVSNALKYRHRQLKPSAVGLVGLPERP